jgi:anti-sigma factor RsiW
MTAENHVREELVAYLSGNLDERTTARVAEHLGGCESCGRELDSLRKAWLSLGSVPDEVPDPRMAERFRRTLDAFIASESAGSREAREADGGRAHRATAPVRSVGKAGWFDWFSPPHPALQFALVLVLFLAGGIVGGMLGYRMGSGDVDTGGMVQLREEVRTVNRLLIVSLLQQQSASERLQGVSWSYKFDRSDPEVTGALLQALNQDPNVNVRLAALDAVSGSIDQPEVRAGLIHSLEHQTSPMIQLAVIDLVVRGGIKESTDALKKLKEAPGVNDVVKQRVEQALQHLNI